MSLKQSIRQRHLSHLDSGELIAFFEPKGGTPKVIAHLPDSVSFGVASRFTDPFSKFSSDGTLHALFTNFTGKSLNTGMVTKKVYTGPEQPDITLELSFEAYYDAAEEVVAPVRELMLMAVGANQSTLSAALSAAGVSEQQMDEQEKEIVNAARELTLINSPEKITIRVGRTLRLPHVYIGNVNATFSNVLDYNRLPTAAQVSLTLIPELPYTQGEILYIFGQTHEIRE